LLDQRQAEPDQCTEPLATWGRVEHRASSQAAIRPVCCSGRGTDSHGKERVAPVRVRHNLSILTSGTAPTASRPVLEGIAADVGVLPNMAAAIAASPVLLQAFDGIRRALQGGELDPIARAVAGLAVGVAVDNRYGVAFHSTVLARLGLGEDDITAIRQGRPPSDPKLAAARDVARAIALERGNADTRAARAAGFGDSEILEIVAECTFAGLVGVVDTLAGRVELGEFLRPQAWAA